MYDVCVIGAGIIGSCAAYNALKYAKNVVLCDQVCIRCICGICSESKLILYDLYQLRNLGLNKERKTKALALPIGRVVIDL